VKGERFGSGKLGSWEVWRYQVLSNKYQIRGKKSNARSCREAKDSRNRTNLSFSFRVSTFLEMFRKGSGVEVIFIWPRQARPPGLFRIRVEREKRRSRFSLSTLKNPISPIPELAEG
jgi:hypothetical protein